MGGAVLTPCSLTWGSPVLESAVSMAGLQALWTKATLSKRTYTSRLHLPGLLPDPVAGRCQPMPSREMPKTLADKSGWVSCGAMAPFPCILVLARFCLCPPRVSVFPVLWKFYSQILLTFKIRFPGDSQSLWPTSRWGGLLWSLEPLWKHED